MIQFQSIREKIIGACFYDILTLFEMKGDGYALILVYSVNI